MSSPPTIKDVAERAGVSKSLVSRVMRGEGLVSTSSRQAVMEAAAELGYRPNAVARSLVQGRTFNVGVLVSDLHNIFFAEVLDGIDAVASAQGYRTLITTGNRDQEAEGQALETLLELRADALILLAPRLAPDRITAASRAVPVAVVGSRPPVSGVDVVVNDDVLGARLAVEHLVGLGHRRIGLIDGGGGAGAAERRLGYRQAMAGRGLEEGVRVVRGDFTEEGGYRGARELLAAAEPPTAIFASNDLAALGALEAIDEAGLRVPADVSLVGYDNTALAALRHISLTTVHQPRRRLGETAMAAVLARLGRPRARAREVVLEPEMVLRETTGPPPGLRPPSR